jgi:hypothetical protein
MVINKIVFVLHISLFPKFLVVLIICLGWALVLYEKFQTNCKSTVWKQYLHLVIHFNLVKICFTVDCLFLKLLKNTMDIN